MTTTKEEYELALELAKANFIKMVRDALGTEPLSPKTIVVLELAFDAGFKTGRGWRDEL